MRITSLRSRIFLLIGAILGLVGVATIALTQKDVRNTVIASEQHAIRNVLTLLAHDSEARWGSLLTDKIDTVRRGRSHLIQLGTMLSSVLNLYQEQVRLGTLSTRDAQTQAIAWINGLKIDDTHFSFVFDRDLNVIASGDPGMRNVNLAQLRDFKGRLLAASTYEEALGTGQSFAIYRWPPSGAQGNRELRYAYFSYFDPWDWVFAVSGSAQEISRQFDRRHAEMEAAISDTLSTLRLAQSGFAFIIEDGGKLLPPLPPEQRALLGDHDITSGKSLLSLLTDSARSDQISTRLFTPQATGQTWQISATHFKPLKWTLVAAVPTTDLDDPANILAARLLALFLAVLAVSLIVAWALSVRISRPLRQLSAYVRSLPEQDLTLPASTPENIRTLPQRQPDEVGQLADTFLYMDHELREKIARLVTETSSRERLQSELSIASTIQNGLLPPPPDQAISSKVDLHAIMRPAREIGGDLYDYFLLPGNRLCFAIGDVSDKGVPAALFMAYTTTLIRAWAGDELSGLVSRINDRLAWNNPRLMFTTLILGILDLGSGRLDWVNAGHPPPLVVDAQGALRTLAGCSGPACGIQDGLEYAVFHTMLTPGDILLAYSDGITEARCAQGGLYGEDRLTALLSHQHTATATDVISTLLADVQAYAVDTEQADDITALAIRFEQRGEV